MVHVGYPCRMGVWEHQERGHASGGLEGVCPVGGARVYDAYSMLLLDAWLGILHILCCLMLELEYGAFCCMLKVFCMMLVACSWWWVGCFCGGGIGVCGSHGSGSDNGRGSSTVARRYSIGASGLSTGASGLSTRVH